MKKVIIAVVVLGILCGAVYYFVPHTRTEYAKDGSREAEGKRTWRKKPIGDWTYWWANGQIKEQGAYAVHSDYNVAYKTGAWRQWDSQGSLCGEVEFVLAMNVYADVRTGAGLNFGSEPQKGYWSQFDPQGKVANVCAYWPQERTASGGIVIGEETKKSFRVTPDNDLLAAIAAAKEEVTKHTSK